MNQLTRSHQQHVLLDFWLRDFAKFPWQKRHACQWWGTWGQDVGEASTAQEWKLPKVLVQVCFPYMWDTGTIGLRIHVNSCLGGRLQHSHFGPTSSQQVAQHYGPTGYFLNRLLDFKLTFSLHRSCWVINRSHSKWPVKVKWIRPTCCCNHNNGLGGINYRFWEWVVGSSENVMGVILITQWSTTTEKNAIER